MSSLVKTRRFIIATADGPLSATVQIAVKIADGKSPDGYGVSDERFNQAASAALASIKTGRNIISPVPPLDGPMTYLVPVEPEGWQPNAE